MDPKLSMTVLLVATIALGVAVALLGFLDSGGTGTVAFVGALVIGGLWAVRAIVADRRRR